MQLTALQQDALVELLNIGFGRAGAALSQLTGHRVILDVPEVTVHEISDLSAALSKVITDEVASVHQIFTGPVAGDALLVLDHQGASRLKELLTDEPALPLAIDASAREVLTEVGNILLNACLGTFGNILKVQVSFSVPRLNLESLNQIVESLRINREGLRYALVVHAGFRLRDREVKGYLVIVLIATALLALDWSARPPVPVSLALAGLASALVFRLNRDLLRIDGTFPELTRRPLIRRLLGL